MWAAIRWLVLRLAAIRWFFKLGWLALLLPIALVLKVIGLPLLGVLSIVALPVLVLLFLFGLPLFLVLIAGGALMGLVGMVLTIGFAVLKIGLFVVLPIWLLWKLAGKLFGWGFRRGDGGTDGEGGSTSGGSGSPKKPADGPSTPGPSSASSTPPDMNMNATVDPID